jgi:GAF domain-containing protein
MEQETERRDEKRLTMAALELSRASSLLTVQTIVRRAARDLTGADGATFVLRDGDQCFYADEDAIGPLWKGARFDMRTCISGWVMRQRSAVVIEDVYADPRIPFEVYRRTFVKSLAMVPICAAAPVGAIGTYWATPHRPGEEEMALLQALADRAADALSILLPVPDGAARGPGPTAG